MKNTFWQTTSHNGDYSEQKVGATVKQVAPQA